MGSTVSLADAEAGNLGAERRALTYFDSIQSEGES